MVRNLHFTELGHRAGAEGRYEKRGGKSWADEEPEIKINSMRVERADAAAHHTELECNSGVSYARQRSFAPALLSRMTAPDRCAVSLHIGPSQSVQGPVVCQLTLW